MDAEDLAFAGIAEQARLLRAGDISSRELVDVYLDRIDRFDDRSAGLNSFREVFADDARAAAAAADERLAAGESAPLLGVPVAFKDELDIEGRVAQHGTSAYDTPATTTAVHVQRVLDAGAINLGMTNLPELAICGFTESPATGDTRNPWDPSRTPGGSSGGSAAAVAAGLVGAASASDGAGSIRIPAAFNGLFGLKPQRGRISLMPESEHWYGMSKTGCLSRRVEDTALWLDVAHGPADGDAHRAEPPSGSYVDAAARAPTRLRIGVSSAHPRTIVRPTVDAYATDALDAAEQLVRDLGHVTAKRDPEFGSAGNGMMALYARGVRQHVVQVPHPDRLDARTRGFGRLGRLVPDRLLRSALRDRDVHGARVNAIFTDLDVLLSPVTGTQPVPVGTWAGKGAVRTLLGMGRVYPFTAIWNYLGNPAAAIPVGFDADGLPLSVMAVAAPNREDTLLSLAQQMQDATDWPAHRPALGT